MSKPKYHCKRTEMLARQLAPRDIYDWLVTEGYFPESYILPPCFHVSKHPRYGKRYFRATPKKYRPLTSQICEVHFPKTDLTDRSFGIIHPEIHNDIALEVAKNWTAILDCLFHPKNRVYSYSFPIPLDRNSLGSIGGLRAGRMIYEWIEMAENDLVEEAYAYKYLVRTDIKNFYPSIYTHSIAWALHSKSIVRQGSNRWDYGLLGNRLDKLFQSANDECTNGLPIGPVVSDLVAEIVLSAVDRSASASLPRSVLAVRFKDDYRILCKSEDEGQKAIKILQQALREYHLVLNEDKTAITFLPEGIFRKWVSQYHAIRPRKRRGLRFAGFKEWFLGVLQIDKDNPSTGVIDRFLADMTEKSYRPLIYISKGVIQKIVSLLLSLADRRIRAFPKALGLVESLMSASSAASPIAVTRHLNRVLNNLCASPDNNRYLISWILYFLKSNRLPVRARAPFNHPIIKSIQSNRGGLFSTCKDFKLFRSHAAAKKAGNLLRHLDVFNPQP